MPAGLLHEEKEELMSKKKQSINYLDLIPQRAETLRWHTDEATGLITLEVENTGVFNTIAQKVFHKPRTTQVHLDETGSYLWPLIDGQKTVADLAECMKQQFGEKGRTAVPAHHQVLPDRGILPLYQVPQPISTKRSGAQSLLQGTERRFFAVLYCFLQFAVIFCNCRICGTKALCPKTQHGLRLPAFASYLERYSRLAGRGPNNSSLFLPQAAVVIVAARLTGT